MPSQVDVTWNCHRQPQGAVVKVHLSVAECGTSGTCVLNVIAELVANPLPCQTICCEL